MGQNVDLPKGYPKDLVPLCQPVSIHAAAESNEKELTIAYTSKATPKEAANFYKDVMADATSKTTADMGDIAIIDGIKAGKKISIAVAATEDDDVQSYITVVVSDADLEESGTSSTMTYESDPEKGIELPANYPKDVAPLYKEDRIESVWEENQTSFTLTYYSSAPLLETTDYYKSLLADATDKNTMVTSDEAILEGTTGGYELFVHVQQNNEDSATSYIRIMVQKVE